MTTHPINPPPAAGEGSMSEWIEHDGKGMPVSVNTFVNVKFTDGSGPEMSPMPAGVWHRIGGTPSCWSHDRGAAHIIAYRLFPTTPEGTPE